MAAIAAVLPYIQAIGAAVSVISAISQGESQSKASQYNAQINTQNAGIARENAQIAAQQADRETYLRLGAIRAAQGASGGTGDAGSVLDVLGDVAAQSELDKQLAIRQGELQARGYSNTSALDSYSASSAKTGSYMKAGSELLSGGVNVAKSYGALSRGSGSTDFGYIET